MDIQTKALIRKTLTGAAVAAIGGALAALATALDSTAPINPQVLGLAMLVGATAALRLWWVKQASSLASIFGLEPSLGDQLAASPGASPEDGKLLYSVYLPDVTPAANRLVGAAPTHVEVRKFSDARLQEAVEHVWAQSGGKSGMFFNVNLSGEIRSGVAVKVGGHLSISGFLLKKPGTKLEGLAELAFAF